MNTDQWLPFGYETMDGIGIRKLYVKGTAWQLYTTRDDGQVLCVEKKLHDQWTEMNWIEPGLFEEINLPGLSFPICLLAGRDGYRIASIQYGPFPRTTDQAMGFIRTFCRCRETMGRFQMDDALYIEQISRILPGEPKRNGLRDEVMLGHYLTGGIDVSITESRRILEYAPYLRQTEMDKILDLLGKNKDEGALGSMYPSSTHQISYQGSATGDLAGTGIAWGEFRLPGRPALERFFREEILEVLENEEEYRRMGVGFPGATLFYGPPGSGKTYAVRKMAEHLGWPVYYIDSGSIGSKYVHETAKMINTVFDKAVDNAPAVIVMDEVEAFLSDRNSAKASPEIKMEESAEFLRRIQEVSEKRILLFGMTNMKDQIDKAFLRHGRFDYQIEVAMPSKEEVSSLLEHMLSDKPVEENIDLDKLAVSLEGRPISDISFMVREAARLTVRSRKNYISMEMLEIACERLAPVEPPKRLIGFLDRR